MTLDSMFILLFHPLRRFCVIILLLKSECEVFVKMSNPKWAIGKTVRCRETGSICIPMVKSLSFAESVPLGYKLH